jgi:large subunit ribosomal protein L18
MATEKNRRAMSVLRHQRLRKRVHGTAARPRLAVFRSARHLYAQLIDDDSATTLAAANTLQQDVKAEISGKSAAEAAAVIGRLIAEKAKAAGISVAVFDRGGFKYHGRIKSLADAAREAGLEI